MPQMQQTRQTPNANHTSDASDVTDTQPADFQQKAKTSCSCLSAGCFRYKTVSQRNTRSDYLRMISML